MSEHNELGKLGEKLACEFLEKKGYRILEKNWTWQKAEIDIVVQKEPDTLVIVEVKTRTNSFIGNPEEFVGKSKIRHLVNAAHQYVALHRLNTEVRFDIVAVVYNSKYQNIEHIENAFYFFQ